MLRGNDGIWRTAGGVPVSAAQQAVLDGPPPLAAKGVTLRSDSLLGLPNGKRRQIDDHELRDEQIATRLITMPRSSINYMVWLQGAAERILYLSQLVAEAREMLAQVGSGWPPSRPMHDAPRDGTYVLLSGTEGKAVCRWVGDPKFGGLGRWQLRGSGATFNNPGRFWDLPED